MKEDFLIFNKYTMSETLRKVASIQGAGTYESKNGLLYKFDYTFVDGSSINANHKTQQAPFKPGDEVVVEERGRKDDFVWGAVRKRQEGFWTGTPEQVPYNKDETTKRIEASWAVNTAVVGLGSLKNLTEVERYARELLLMRDRIVETPYDAYKGQEPHKWTKEDMQTAEATQDMEIPMPTDNDLPF
tara:strand:+ start:19528 stop:20088 length:561 start_codon:yes stop_codon:yes gene_type:complete